MLHREIIAVYCENDTKRIGKIQFMSLKACGTLVENCVVEGLVLIHFFIYLL